MGKWKGIRKNIQDGNVGLELYDLAEDMREQSDLAAQNPEIVDQIEHIMTTARTEPEIERFRMVALGDKKMEKK